MRCKTFKVKRTGRLQSARLHHVEAEDAVPRSPSCTFLDKRAVAGPFLSSCVLGCINSDRFTTPPLEMTLKHRPICPSRHHLVGERTTYLACPAPFFLPYFAHFAHSFSMSISSFAPRLRTQSLPQHLNVRQLHAFAQLCSLSLHSPRPPDLSCVRRTS